MTYKLNALNIEYDEIVYQRMNSKPLYARGKRMNKKYDEVLNFIEESKDEDHIKNLRKKVLDKIGEKHYISWFKDRKITVWGSSYHMEVPNSFIKDMCVMRFKKLLKELNIYVGLK